MTEVKIAPSILSADLGAVTEAVAQIEEGGADWVHLDIMDGHFVPNITFGAGLTGYVNRSTDLTLDVHLMIENPDDFIVDFANHGADLITVHAETCRHLHRTLSCIRERSLRAGVAINPATPLSVVEEVVSDIDLLLIMSVNPGFGGQSYIPNSTDKISRARDLLEAKGRSGVELEVDGGVHAGNAAEIVRAGATVLVAGSAVYGHPEGPAQAVRLLREAASAG